MKTELRPVKSAKVTLAQRVIFSDPVLCRLFFRLRPVAPKHGRDAIVNCLLFDITQLKQRLEKAADIRSAETWQRMIRRRWFTVMRHCDGFHVDLPAGYRDGCEHVELFRDDTDCAAQPNMRQRAALWYRYENRPPPAWY